MGVLTTFSSITVPLPRTRCSLCILVSSADVTAVERGCVDVIGVDGNCVDVVVVDIRVGGGGGEVVKCAMVR
ncbi:hypothetical protein HID58_001126 [Brassica napus]|uniref:Secreted protein n=1 Tax=Brassica napus TaxID=3708 RepID=A0ABQ8EII1_BRANA|nr:hypothetical protein HID58_001126 [Brassica napus]